MAGNNANNFQASRPQPIYAPVQSGGNRSASANVGFLAGQLPGLLQVAELAKNLFGGGSPADKYNLAMATESRQRASKGAWDRIIAVKDPEDRRRLFEEEKKQNPELFKNMDSNNINFANLKEHDAIDFMERNAQLELGKTFENSTQGNFGVGLQQGQQTPQGQVPVEGSLTSDLINAGGEADVTQEGMGSQQQTTPPQQQGVDPGTWSTTQGDVQPTEVYSGQGQFPQNKIDETPQPISSATTQWNEEEVAPTPTEISIAQGPPNPEQTKKLDVVRDMNSRGYPITEEDVWISPQTGEAKLNPALATRFPEFGPGAYQDVLAAGPEDAGIRQSVTELAPNMEMNQLRAMQLGSILRVARSYDLSVQPSAEDIYTATMPINDLKLLAADLRVKTGLPYDEKYLTPELYNMAIAHGQWMRKDVSNAIRKMPETIDLLMKKAALPPEYQKLVETYGEKFAQSAMGYEEYKAKLAQINALNKIRERELDIDEQRNQSQFITGMARAGAAQASADAAFDRNNVQREQIAANAPLNEARIKQLTAQAAKLEQDHKVDEASFTKTELDMLKIANEMGARDIEVPSMGIKTYSELLKNDQNTLSGINSRISALTVKLPNAGEGAIADLIMNSNNSLTAEEKKLLKDNGMDAQALAELGELKDKRTQIQKRIDGYQTKIDTYAGQWETAISKSSTLPQKQAKMLDNLRTAFPVVGESVMRNTVIRNAKHKNAGNVFNMLDRLSNNELKSLSGSSSELVKKLRDPKSPFHIPNDVIEQDSDLLNVFRSYSEWKSVKNAKPAQ